jgi:hypothetical protein
MNRRIRTQIILIIGLCIGGSWSSAQTTPFRFVAWGDSRGATKGVGLDELLTPIPLTLVFQLFGYYRGVARGYNPDTLRTDHRPNAKAWITAFPIGKH